MDSIVSLTRQFQVGRSQLKHVLQKMFPLRPLAAKTICCCQDDTLDQVVVNFTKTRERCPNSLCGSEQSSNAQWLVHFKPIRRKYSCHSSRRCQNSEMKRNSSSFHMPHLHVEIPFHAAFHNVHILHSHIGSCQTNSSLFAYNILMFR